jgi:RimJ/RimL family protein N-acetyltransferase
VTELPIFQVRQITTDRLLLRGIGPHDFERYADMMADAQVAHHLMDGRPLLRCDTPVRRWAARRL